MFSFLLSLLIQPMQTWQHGWKPQQNGCRRCSYCRQTCLFCQAWSNLALDRCHMVPLAVDSPCCCCPAVNAERAVSKCAGECLASAHFPRSVNDFFLEWCLPLRLQEEDDVNIWTCYRVPIQRPGETGWMSSLRAYGNPEVFTSLLQNFCFGVVATRRLCWFRILLLAVNNRTCYHSWLMCQPPLITASQQRWC